MRELRLKEVGENQVLISSGTKTYQRDAEGLKIAEVFNWCLN